jgi:putative ABC transport system permease protein
MTSPFDWETDIRAEAARAGVELADTTVEEIAEHLDDLYSAARREGCGEAEAMARARRALGESTLGVLRRPLPHHAPAWHGSDPALDAAGGRRLNVSAALRLAVRQLRLHRGFAAVTILVLALGVGASTTVFSIVDSVLMRPLPYRDPDRLMTLWDASARRGRMQERISPVNFMDYRALPVFEGAAAWWRPSLNLTDPGLDPMRVNAIEVSGNFFDVLGVRPQLGQGFPVGGPFFVQREPLVVISDRLWRTRYGGNPAIVGTLLRLNDRPHVLAGVMPQRFHYPDDIDVWQRLNWDLTQHSRAAHFMEALVRLRDDTTVETATAASSTLARRLQAEFPQTNRDWDVTLVPLLDEQLGYYRPALLVLVGAVALLLVIGCLNIASLLLTRALSRGREIAVRIAMGASPRQLVVQLLAESLVLSSIGAALGVTAAAVALPVLVRLAPAGIPRLDEAQVDLRALALAVVMAVTTSVVFGLVPAGVLVGRKMSADLRSGERGSSRGPRRAYSVIVAGQVALACTLLVGSALLIRTVVKMVTTPIGIAADDAVITSVQLPIPNIVARMAVQQSRAIADTHELLLERIRQQPGVTSAGAASVLPLELDLRLPFELDRDATLVRADDRSATQYHAVSDGYFETMRATLAAGRPFSKFDTADATPVAIVNETFVSRYLEGRQPLGRFVITNARYVGPRAQNLMVKDGDPKLPESVTPARFEIVGVVKDIRNMPFGQPVEPAVYFSSQQFPFREMYLVVRASNTTAAVAAVRASLATTAPTVPMGVVRTWAERMAAETQDARLLMTVLLFFGVAAASLAALGVYGLFSWSVAQRTRELAIRLTLGARPVSVGAAVVRQSAALVAIGLVAGLGIVRISEAALARVLFDLSPHDPGSLAAAGILLAVVAIGACVPPALRALRVDPVQGLRAE